MSPSTRTLLGGPTSPPTRAVSQIVEHNWLISRPPERFAHVGADISCATCHEHCRLNHLAQCYNPNLTGATNEPRGDTQRRSFSESSISLTQDLLSSMYARHARHLLLCYYAVPPIHVRKPQLYRKSSS